FRLVAAAQHAVLGEQRGQLVEPSAVSEMRVARHQVADALACDQLPLLQAEPPSLVRAFSAGSTRAAARSPARRRTSADLNTGVPDSGSATRGIRTLASG